VGDLHGTFPGIFDINGVADHRRIQPAAVHHPATVGLPVMAFVALVMVLVVVIVVGAIVKR